MASSVDPQPSTSLESTSKKENKIHESVVKLAKDLTYGSVLNI